MKKRLELLHRVFISPRTRLTSWDPPQIYPTQPVLVYASDLQSLKRRQRNLISTFLTPFLKRINELISINYFASHGWLQTLLRAHFPYWSDSSFEQKAKSQEDCLPLIQGTGCLFSGNRRLVKMVCAICPVTGDRDRFRQCEGNSIPQCAIESNWNKAMQSALALTVGIKMLGLDYCFSQLTSPKV